MAAGSSDFDPLGAAFDGRLVLPEDPGYETARRVWNGMIDRHPAAIVCCASAEDVAAALSLAQRRGWPVAVRGGGHNVAGNGTCEGGLVVDLSLMAGITIDATARRARVGGGATMAQLDRATQEYGLATTGGIMPSTGVGGFTLGGGLGVLMRSYGLACDNLLAADVVTADGRRVRASAEENPELFWALRGGGGNFGVVTSFEFQLHSVGPLLTGRMVWPWSEARQGLRFCRDFLAQAPDNLAAYLTLGSQDDGTLALFARCHYNGPVDEGAAAISPLRELGSRVVGEFAPMSYTDIQRIPEPAFPPGRLDYWKANFVDELGDDLIDVMVEAYEAVPSPHSMIALEQMGGAVARVPQTATAFEHRQALFSLLILGGWDDPGGTDVNVSWVRGVWEQTRPLSSSAVYVNYLGEEGADRVRDAYGVNHSRLRQVKAIYDPDNFFRLNQNIQSAKS